MDNSILANVNLFNFAHTRACTYLEMFKYPWEAVKGIEECIERISLALGEEFSNYGGGVFVHRSARVAPSAVLIGPCIVEENAEVRHCAFVRGGVLIGKGCVIGNSVELKNSILFDGVQIPHLSYAGDSILGYRAHLGAGVIISNLKADRSEIAIKVGNGRILSGLVKCGAFLGDGVEVGCNAVLCPGTVIGRGARIYPLALARGTYPENCIVKRDGKIEKLHR